MMDFFERLAALRRGGRSFAVATVVARQAPVSAHLGDRAIVLADGRMEGFVGGACSREIVRRQALAAIGAREGRLVSIRPDAGEVGPSTAEHAVVPMTCASEGAVDVFVEPFVPPRSLIVVGATPVADALARLGQAMSWDVARVVDPREQPDVEATAGGVTVVPLEGMDGVLQRATADGAAVVASQGHYDEEALAAILTRPPSYVGLVASRRRGAVVRALVEEGGARGANAVRNPAGLDLGARTPGEVALSILAEIVQGHPSRAGKTAPAAASEPAPAAAIDPVCGMEVNVATARHTAEVGGVTYYFCCAGCRAKFLKDPQQYEART